MPVSERRLLYLFLKYFIWDLHFVIMVACDLMALADCDGKLMVYFKFSSGPSTKLFSNLNIYAERI